MITAKILIKLDKLADCKDALGYIPARQSRRPSRRRQREMSARAYLSDAGVAELAACYGRWLAAIR